jgi:aconitate hydratase
VTAEQIEALCNWDEHSSTQGEIQFTPARVIMQDFTGVPCVVDLASMREAVQSMGGYASKINPIKTTQMVIDHSLQIDKAGSSDALESNMLLEFERNRERYEFLKWGSQSFDNFTVIPPGVGIIHQVNIEKLAQVVMHEDPQEDARKNEEEGSGASGSKYGAEFFDTCVGTDSHTTMVNGLGVLGWGVGGIEAEAAMLGQSISMLIPPVLGVKCVGTPKPGVLATDIVLTLTQKLREIGVVGKFVEFFGDAVKDFSLPLRATISNMCPEFGATCAIFAPDETTLEYLRLTSRSEEAVRRVQEYCTAQEVFDVPADDTRYSQVLEFDLSEVRASIAGPKRPQDRISLDEAKEQFEKDVLNYLPDSSSSNPLQSDIIDESRLQDDGGMPEGESLKDGDIIIASITSCTNTSNPEVLIAAGLIAKKAYELGLQVPEHVRTSFAPGSRVVSAYLENAGLQEYLDQLGFNVVGYGCATCIGNSGPNDEAIRRAVSRDDLAVCAVLSGNRNFEGRINPDVKMNYLASPALVVAYALSGTMDIDLTREPLGNGKNGPVYLKDLWPSASDIESISNEYINSKLYESEYEKVIGGNTSWKELQSNSSNIFSWDDTSTYIRKAPYFDGMKPGLTPVENVRNARVLALLGDSVTTDHISPAGSIKADSPAGRYLREAGVLEKDFNSYGSRRGNHEVMVRGTFANIRLSNLLVERFTGNALAGGWTVNFTTDSPGYLTGGSSGKPSVSSAYTPVSIFDASRSYLAQSTPLVVFAGREYGTGSSRDWAAKGTALLGVKAVIAQSFERIHRSNLIGMGVLPLEFELGDTFDGLGLRGDEKYDILGIDALNRGEIPDLFEVVVKSADASGDVSNENDDSSVLRRFKVKVRIDTQMELQYYLHGGILQYVLRGLV